MFSKARHIFMSALLFASFVGATPPAAPTPSPEADDQFFASTLLDVIYQNGAVGRYAFYLKPYAPPAQEDHDFSYLVTLANPVSALYVILKEKNTLQEVAQKLVINTRRYDLSLGHIHDPRKVRNFFRIAPEPHYGGRIITVGTPAGEFPVATQELRQLNTAELNQNCNLLGAYAFRAKTVMLSGFRGAPVVESSSRKIIGVLIGACRADLTIYFALPVHDLMKIYESVK